VNIQPVRTLGIDPTSRKALGWALVEAGQALAWGQISVAPAEQTEDGIARYITAEFLKLLAELYANPDTRPVVVAFEKPIANTGMVNRYLGQEERTGTKVNAGQITGGFSSTIDLAIVTGNLISVVYLHYPDLEVARINPGSVKRLATGRVTGDPKSQKKVIRENARLSFAESLIRRGLIADHTQLTLRQVKEHEADALFIGLEGARLSMRRRQEAQHPG
jgi:hypothetical protein